MFIKCTWKFTGNSLENLPSGQRLRWKITIFVAGKNHYSWMGIYVSVPCHFMFHVFSLSCCVLWDMPCIAHVGQYQVPSDSDFHFLFPSKCLGTSAIANIRWFSGAGSRSEPTAGLPQVTKAAQQGRAWGYILFSFAKFVCFSKQSEMLTFCTWNMLKHVETIGRCSVSETIWTPSFTSLFS